MAKKSVSKQLFYKQAEFLNPSAQTLQTLLHQALEKLKIQDRQEKIVEGGDAGQQWLKVINYVRDYSGMKFGSLVLSSPGTNHAVISLTPDAGVDELGVSPHPPPAGKHYAEPHLFFGVRDNHLVCLQSKSLRTEDLEKHLNWLLAGAKVIPANQRVSLSDAIPDKIKDKIAKAPLKRISLGVPMFDEAESEPEPAAKKRGESLSSALSTVKKGLGLEAIKSFLTDKQFAALGTDKLAEMPDIQVKLEIKVVGRPKQDATGDKVMKKLMHQLRHVDNPDFLKIDVKGMGKLDGKDLRVQTFKNFDSNGGMLDVADAYDTMRVWLESLIFDGIVKTG